MSDGDEMTTDRTRDLCPYTLKPLKELKDTSIEHIFPEGIGGIASFSVLADKKANNDLGTFVDAPLINSPSITSLRQGLKIGSSVVKYDGVAPKKNISIKIQIDPEGKHSEHVVKPVDLDPKAKVGELYYGNSLNQEKHYMKYVESFYDKLGKDVEWQEPEKLEDVLHVDNGEQGVRIIRGLAKIAYLTVYEYLGDDYLQDPLVAEWHKILFSPKAEDALNFNIRCVMLNPNAAMILPDTTAYQHAATVVNIPGKAPIAVAVSLFGRKELSFYAVASETCSYGLKPYEGKVTVCDTHTPLTHSWDFAEVFEIK